MKNEGREIGKKRVGNCNAEILELEASINSHLYWKQTPAPNRYLPSRNVTWRKVDLCISISNSKDSSAFIKFGILHQNWRNFQKSFGCEELLSISMASCCTQAAVNHLQLRNFEQWFHCLFFGISHPFCPSRKRQLSAFLFGGIFRREGESSLSKAASKLKISMPFSAGLPRFARNSRQDLYQADWLRFLDTQVRALFWG